MKNNKQKIAIIGFGRFGKLLANILSPYGEVFIIARKKIDNVKFKQIEYKDLKKIDWVIPSVPISSLKKVLKEINPFLKKGALVMDVCSVKVHPSKWMQEILSKDIQILASHPMFGPDSVKNGKLENLDIVFCPIRIDDIKSEEVEEIFESMGLNVVETTPEDHDQQNAISLALVHFIGRGLKGIDVSHQKITTMGFKRLLQLKDNVTNDSMELFRDMNNFNPYAREIRRRYVESLQKIDSMLE
jgi:prephenate dehydrogenase